MQLMYSTASESLLLRVRSPTAYSHAIPLTVEAASVSQLYAFFYTPNPLFPSSDGWSMYSAREEFGRMGVGLRTKAWRFTDINKDYDVRTRSRLW
jgi:hypothetical protein